MRHLALSAKGLARMARILLVLSGADHWTLNDGSKHPSGFWVESVVAPHRALREAGHEVLLGTPGGVTPTIDQLSLAPGAVGGVERAHELVGYLGGLGAALQVPEVLEEQDGAALDAIVVAGGHAALEDLAEQSACAALLACVFAQGGVVAAVSHGVAALLPATAPDGSWAFAGRRMTCFTAEEERIGGLAPQAPWLLEDAVVRAGAVLEPGPAWRPHIVVDGRLLTGQNPVSSALFAQALVDLLGR